MSSWPEEGNHILGSRRRCGRSAVSRFQFHCIKDAVIILLGLGCMGMRVVTKLGARGFASPRGV